MSKCETPLCHRKAVVRVTGTNPIDWSDDSTDNLPWEDEGVKACAPCAAMFEQGATSSPNEVDWSILDGVDPSDVEDVEEALMRY